MLKCICYNLKFFFNETKMEPDVLSTYCFPRCLPSPLNSWSRPSLIALHRETFYPFSFNSVLPVATAVATRITP